MFGKKAILTLVVVVAVTLAFEAPARAQSPATSRDDDPVASAIERIHSAVERRATIADRVLTATKILNESKFARKQGERERAKECDAQPEEVQRRLIGRPAQADRCTDQ